VFLQYTFCSIFCGILMLFCAVVALAVLGPLYEHELTYPLKRLLAYYRVRISPDRCVNLQAVALGFLAFYFGVALGIWLVDRQRRFWRQTREHPLPEPNPESTLPKHHEPEA